MQTLPRTPSFRQIEVENEQILRAADERFVATHRAEDCKLCNAGPQIPFSWRTSRSSTRAKRRSSPYEALARGPNGEPAKSVLDHTLHNNRYSMDQRCREKAIAISAALGILDTGADLCINFYPNAVYQPRQCLMRTFNAAQSVSFPLNRIIFEITEVEEVKDHGHLREIMTEYRKHGLRVAIDDFGAGHSGLSLLPSSSRTSSRSTRRSSRTSMSAAPASPSSAPSFSYAMISARRSSPKASSARARCKRCAASDSS